MASELPGFLTSFLINPLQSPWGSWRGRVQLAQTWIYSWGWGEGSGHHSATISSKERTVLPAFQISEHTAVFWEPPAFPRCLLGLFMQKWSSLLTITCVPLRRNQILVLCYFLIIWNKKSFDFLEFKQGQPQFDVPKPDRSACLWNFPCLRMFYLESSEPPRNSFWKVSPS